MAIAAPPPVSRRAPVADDAVGRRRRPVTPLPAHSRGRDPAVRHGLSGRLADRHVLPEVRRRCSSSAEGPRLRRPRQLHRPRDEPEFWIVAVRSIVFCIITALVTVVIGMLLAVLMGTVHPAARIILQVSLLLAWAMPVVAAMTVWIWLFDRRRGVVNYLLDLIPGVRHEQLQLARRSPSTFFMVASIIVIWMSVPFVAFSVLRGPHPGLGRGHRGLAARRRQRAGSGSATSCCRWCGRSS